MDQVKVLLTFSGPAKASFPRGRGVCGHTASKLSKAHSALDSGAFRCHSLSYSRAPPASCPQLTYHLLPSCQGPWAWSLGAGLNHWMMGEMGQCQHRLCGGSPPALQEPASSKVRRYPTPSPILERLPRAWGYMSGHRGTGRQSGA